MAMLLAAGCLAAVAQEDRQPPPAEGPESAGPMAVSPAPHFSGMRQAPQIDAPVNDPRNHPMRPEMGRPDPVPLMGPDSRCGGDPRVPSPELCRELGASDAQIQAIEKTMFETRLKGIDLRATVEKAELQLEHLLQSGTSEDPVVIKAVEMLNQARADLFMADIQTLLKVRQILGDGIVHKLQEHRGRPRPMAGERGPMPHPAPDSLPGSNLPPTTRPATQPNP